MNGPCLCGDPACGNCFPSGQVRMKCDNCDWHGKLYECDGDELDGYGVSVCPMCGCIVEEEA